MAGVSHRAWQLAAVSGRLCSSLSGRVPGPQTYQLEDGHGNSFTACSNFKSQNIKTTERVFDISIRLSLQRRTCFKLFNSIKVALLQ